MGTTEEEAFAAMLAHHRVLEGAVAAKVRQLRHEAAAGASVAAALADLVAYLEHEVLTHALAEEQTIYPAAAAAGLAETVAAMTSEHRLLAEAVGELAGAEALEAGERAGRVAALFEGHVARENEVVLPRLLVSPATDLARLLLEMHAAFESARARAARAVDVVSSAGHGPSTGTFF